MVLQYGSDPGWSACRERYLCPRSEIKMMNEWLAKNKIIPAAKMKIAHQLKLIESMMKAC